MTTPLLSLRQVAFTYPRSTARVLEEVSFDILPGTVNAVLGPNGAGKSTLLYLLLGRYPPRKGEILLKGAPLGEYSRKELSRTVGLVPQKEFVPFDYSIFEYVLLGRTPHLGFLSLPRQEDLASTRQALHSLGLEALAERSVATLSGGEHQLALIARTLAQSPAILLLDEPTAHLDLANKKRVLQIMRSLADRQMTVIYTTHDPESAAAIADHVILMRSGRVLRQGRLDEVFNAANLSETYGTDLDVARIEGTNVILLNL